MLWGLKTTTPIIILRNIYNDLFPFHFRGSGVPSDLTTSSSNALGLLQESSRWTAVASDRALMNAPLHKQSCSDRGIRPPTNYVGPVNSSTFHRLHNGKRNIDEHELVANMTTCCPFWNFIKRKQTW